MADDQNEIRISITLDDGSVREGFARIKKEGDESGKSLGDAFSAAKKELLALLAAYIGFEAVKRVVEESIKAASDYGTALNNLNKSLSSAGTYSKEASQSFLELAESLEKNTTISVTHALSLEALARNYAATNEQAKALTKAAIDMGAATGKDATTALQQLGGTLDGTSGRLGKLIPQIRSLTEYQLRTGEAISIVAARFKDAAAGDVNTYAGSLQKLSNSLEKVLISMGEMVTQSPTIRTVIKFLSDEFLKLANYIKTISLENFINGAANGLVLFGRMINTFVILPLELLYEVAKISFNGIRDLFQVFIFGAATAASKVANFFAPNSQIAQTLKTFADSSLNVLDDFVQQTNESIDKLGDTKLSDTIGADLVALQDKLNSANPFEKIRKEMKDTHDESYGLSGGLENLSQSFTLMQQGASNSFELMAHDAVKAFQEIGSATSKVLVAGFSNAMVQMGRALVQGKDLFKAFAGAILSAMGQAAIQMGAFYILEGVARGFSSYGFDATAYGLIATGSALSVLGGVLGAVGEGVSGGGGAAISAGGGSGGGGADFSGGPGANPAQAIDNKETQRVQINIQGSVFDTKETGLRLVDIINDAFNTQGARVQVGTT